MQLRDTQSLSFFISSHPSPHATSHLLKQDPGLAGRSDDARVSGVIDSDLVQAAGQQVTRLLQIQLDDADLGSRKGKTKNNRTGGLGVTCQATEPFPRGHA